MGGGKLHPLHAGSDSIDARSDDQMNVVRHQAIAEDLDLQATALILESFQACHGDTRVRKLVGSIGRSPDQVLRKLLGKVGMKWTSFREWHGRNIQITPDNSSGNGKICESRVPRRGLGGGLGA